MRIAIVGTGVSGLVTAHMLHHTHDVTVFEASDRIGGHVNTIDVERPDGGIDRIDTGFIVYNRPNYPHFSRLLEELGVETQPSDMSFSVRCDRTGLEYNGSTIRQLFAQPRNLLRPGFHRMLFDILRFNREAVPAIENGAGALTLGEYVEAPTWIPEGEEAAAVPAGEATAQRSADAEPPLPGRRLRAAHAEVFEPALPGRR